MKRVERIRVSDLGSMPEALFRVIMALPKTGSSRRLAERKALNARKAFKLYGNLAK